MAQVCPSKHFGHAFALKEQPCQAVQLGAIPRGEVRAWQSPQQPAELAAAAAVQVAGAPAGIEATERPLLAVPVGMARLVQAAAGAPAAAAAPATCTGHGAEPDALCAAASAESAMFKWGSPLSTR